MRARPNSNQSARGIPKILKTVLAISFSLAAIGVFALGISSLQVGSVGEIALTAEKVQQMRSYQGANRKDRFFHAKSDAVTTSGIRGAVSIDESSGELVMELRDRDGAPINKAHVVARITQPDMTLSDSQKLLLRQRKGARYAVDVDTDKKGPWLVSITAQDPNPSADSSFLFHVEKQFQVGTK